MDLAIGIILIVIASFFLILTALFIIGSIMEEEFSKESSPWTVVFGIAGVVLLAIGLIVTIPSCQSYDYVESYITSFHPNEETFVVGMSQGKYYYMLDANTSNLIEKRIDSSKLIRDEELKPYIQKVSVFGSKDVTYYIHVPADCTVFIM